jgi:hypothetical protein
VAISQLIKTIDQNNMDVGILRWCPADINSYNDAKKSIESQFESVVKNNAQFTDTELQKLSENLYPDVKVETDVVGKDGVSVTSHCWSIE